MKKKLNIKDKISIYSIFRSFYNTFIKKGYGVVLGEYGWTDRTNLDNLCEKAEFFVSTANKFGIPCLVWDNGSDFRLFDRKPTPLNFPVTLSLNLTHKKHPLSAEGVSFIRHSTSTEVLIVLPKGNARSLYVIESPPGEQLIVLPIMLP